MESIWRRTVQIREREALQAGIKTDVAVIGAGMAGILTAYYLQKEGKRVVVLEADRIAGGQTENTTAKITSQHGLIYRKLLKAYGKETLCLYAKANEAAIAEYEELIRQNHIECDFERLPAYLYSTVDENKLKEEADIAREAGIKAYFTKENDLPFSVAGMVCFEGQAQFHPLKLIERLSENLVIYEKTRVLRVHGHYLETTGGRIQAEHIVFATHYPFPNIPGFYFVRQHQERSYVLELAGVPKKEGMYYCAEDNGVSLRWYKDRLLLGGGAHRTGKGGAESGYSALRKKAEEYYPEGKETAFWSAQDCISHDDLPFIGAFSVFRNNWHVVSGLKKWGMTGSMIAAKIICDRICGRKNEDERLFTPVRLKVKTAFPLFWEDLGISVQGLAKGHFHLPFAGERGISVGEAAVIRSGFRRYGVYRDRQGIVHRISVKCPHLGCELVWNAEEKTWDCPCHGSRFDYDGNLVDNPAQANAHKQY